MLHPHRSKSSGISPAIAFFFCTTFLAILATSSSIVAQQPIATTSTPETPAPISKPSSSAETMLLNVTVTNQTGRYILGLDKKQFTLYDNKAPQEITFFGVRDVPASIGIVLDISGSMSEEYDRKRTDFVKEALTRFLQLGNPSNEYFLIVFNDVPKVILDGVRDVMVATAVDKMLSYKEGARHNTAFYDACRLSIEKVQGGKYPKRALILISDGEDNNSNSTMKDVSRLLKQSDAMVYSVDLTNSINSNFIRSNPGSRLGKDGADILNELSNISGGLAAFPMKTSQTVQALEQIALELRSQYRIGFSPAKPIAGKSNSGARQQQQQQQDWHRLKIEMALPPGVPPGTKRLSARTRSGYFVNASPH